MSTELRETSETSGNKTMSVDVDRSIVGISSSQNQEGKELTSPIYGGRKEKDAKEKSSFLGSESPFLGYTDPNPKAHHLPASVTFNEKIMVQNKIRTSGEMIDIVDDFSFISFITEEEMMSYDDMCSWRASRVHRHWLKKKKRCKRLLSQDRMGRSPKMAAKEPTFIKAEGTSAAPKERIATRDTGVFARTTEEGMTRMHKDELLEPPTSLPMQILTPAETIPADTRSKFPVDPNTSIVQPTEADGKTKPIQKYQEVSATDILYPKEKYEYYNKELCKESKADGSSVYVQRAGKLVPLTTILKTQKLPAPENSIKKSVELVYVYDGGKLLTLGGFLSKVNPSNSDSVHARVVLPMGMPPIMKGETVASRAKKVQAVEINEDMAKFALSALQSSHLKSRLPDTDFKNENDKEQLPALISSTSAEKSREVEEVAEISQTKKSEAVVAPKISVKPTEISVKPTKTNILDIIAAKLATSDEESEGKEETEERETGGDAVMVAKENKAAVRNIETPRASGGKEESKASAKNETHPDSDSGGKEASLENRDVLLKQEDVKEKCKDIIVVKSQDTKDTVELIAEMKKEEKPGDLTGGEASGKIKEERGNTPSLIGEMETLPGLGEIEMEEESIPIKPEAKECQEKADESDVMVLEENGTFGEPLVVKETEFEKKGKDVRSEAVASNKKDKENKSDMEVQLEDLEEEIKEKESVTSGEKSEKKPESFEVGCHEMKPQNDQEEDSINSKSEPVNTKEKEPADSELGEDRNEVPAAICKGPTEPPIELRREGTSEITTSCISSSPPKPITADDDNESKTASSFLLSFSQESGERMDTLEKGQFSEPKNADIQRRNVKSHAFKRSICWFPSLSREMKRLNMNFVNCEPQEASHEGKEDVAAKIKEGCDNENCCLGCICESQMCRCKSVEHCGHVECVFECICCDESWKLPSGSGRTINGVTIFNLDQKQMRGREPGEKDFRRTVIQTGSEVILVGSVKKRQRKLPGRFQETTAWRNPYLHPVSHRHYVLLDFPVLSDYPAIPVFEASKYMKMLKLNIPWYDIKGISVWCMEHSSYDCSCLTDTNFNDPMKTDSSKNRTPRLEQEVLRYMNTTDTSSTLFDLEEALHQKTNSESLSTILHAEQSPPEAVTEASCSIMNIIVNNSETRHKYTLKLKEWYHSLEKYCARTAGYTKSSVTVGTKNMIVSGLLTEEATPEQIVESFVKSLRHQKSTADDIKLPSLPCGSNFVPLMGDSIPDLKNAIRCNSDNAEISSEDLSCPLVDLTNSSEVVVPSSMPIKTVKLVRDHPQERMAKGLRYSKGIGKRKLSGPSERPFKRAQSAIPSNEGKHIPQAGRSLTYVQMFHQTKNFEPPPVSEKLVPRKTVSLLEMMVAEEKRGELELDLSSNVPGNALLVAEVRFRKLINMNIIGVIGISKARRCIIAPVNSTVALHVMNQTLIMIKNSTLDVGPKMRSIFFPTPYTGIRSRYVLIRCNAHCKWEIVGVVQKKGPIRSPSKDFELRGKANIVKPQQPQVIDLEEEERQKQLTEETSSMSQENTCNVVQPVSHDEKDSGAWEGSFPCIVNVHSASNSGMTQLIGFPEKLNHLHETETHEYEKPQKPSGTELPQKNFSVKNSLAPQKTIPDLVPVSSASVSCVYQGQDQVKSSSTEVIATSSSGKENQSQKLYIVPTAFSVSSVSRNTLSSHTITYSPFKTVKPSMTDSKVFCDYHKKPLTARKQSSWNIKSISSKLSSARKCKSSVLSLTQREGKIIVVTKADEGCNSDASQIIVTSAASTSNKILNTPVTLGSVPRLLFVPTVSGGSYQHMMLLPTVPGGAAPADSNAKMKMVLLPSPQDANKRLLIPAAPDASDGGGATALPPVADASTEGDKKKMLMLPSSVINNFILRTPASGDPRAATVSQSYQQTYSGTLFVPVNNTGIPPTMPVMSEKDKPFPTEHENSNSQDLSDGVVIGPTTNSHTIKRMRTISESSPVVRKETPFVLLVPSPTVSSCGTAETNVVSSVNTISSTMLDKTLNTVGMNSVLKKTHINKIFEVELMKENSKLEFGAVGSLCEREREKITRPLPNQNICCKNSRKSVEFQEKQIQMKKDGYYWSAVDLSLKFKSIKLGWLLGTIRRNVLVNIYHMSKKTHSPVTLSVKNGTSTSMLYGFARTCGQNPMPILILGSVVSAVLSSSSVPDFMLFQISSIKYFIKENTGEISSYTHASESHLVKLASKKIGNGGEMVRIGEKIEIEKLRDSTYCTIVENADKEIRKEECSS